MPVLKEAGPAALAAALLAAGCAKPPDNLAGDAPPPVEASVDLERYLGRWYEIARYPNGFEDEDCVGVTADYSRRDDGLIRVLNTCRKGGLDGEEDRAEGRARVIEGSNGAKLEVSFFGPFWGDYWILDVDDDYGWSLVGGPEGRYLWILSRTPTLPDDVLEARLQTLRDLGYDTDALFFTPQ